MTEPPMIPTKRLLLRQLRAADAEPLHALFNDWNVVQWLSTPPWPYTLDDAHAFISVRMQDERTFAVTLDGALIGCIDARTFTPAYIEAAPPGPNLGYWLGRRFWARGYMTEAARAFLTHIFASHAGDIVYSGALAENRASLNIQKKLGFVPHVEGTHFFRPLNEKRPHVYTRLDRTAFQALSP